MRIGHTVLKRLVVLGLDLQIVIVKNALNARQLETMRAAADEVFAEILSYRGAEDRAYHTESGRLPHRYSYGTSSASRQMLHHPAWAMLTVRSVEHAHS